MKKTTQKTTLYILFVLGILGLITSAYLTWTHFVPASAGAACDLSSQISCSLVNTSVYSELFNVPVALFGALWFVVFLGLIWNCLKTPRTILLLLLWNVLGFLFMIYLIIAEIILRALCPFCTVVHVIVLVALVVSYLLYQAQSRKPRLAALRKDVKKWILIALVLNLAVLVFFNLNTGEQENYDALAQCITDKGINMYGSFRCGVCAKTRAMFGDSFQYINEIECHPQGENPQTELCIEKGIEGTPTWIMEPEGEEIKRYYGFMDIEQLREFSGCLE